MSLRRYLNRNPAVAIVAVLVVLTLCGFVVWAQATSEDGAKAATSAFYTVDDGKTWFVDDAAKLTPFDKDGKQAVRVHLFKCGDQEVVGYLERYTTKGKQVTEKFRAEQQASPGVPPKSGAEIAAIGRNVTEVKRPGDPKWTPMSQALKIVQYTCTGGAKPVAVQP